MKLIRTERFKRGLRRFPKSIQRAFYKQAELLLANLTHPSLRAKKYDETIGLWQARINRNTRFYFLIEGDTYILVSVEKHRD